MLNWDSKYSCTTDGASNMMGKHNWLFTRVKDYCHYLGKNNCAANNLTGYFCKRWKSQEIT